MKKPWLRNGWTEALHTKVENDLSWCINNFFEGLLIDYDNL